MIRLFFSNIALLITFCLVTTCGGSGSGGGETATAPIIISQPMNQVVPVGQTATFSVFASGLGNPGYQWWRNGIAISGATQADYKTNPAQLSDNGSEFYVVVKSANGMIATSSTAHLSVTPGVFSATGSMSGARSKHTATRLLNGQVLMAGGVNQSSYGLETAELYDPVTGMFSLTGSMGFGREFHSSTLLLDGRVLVAGGVNYGRIDGGYPDVELYDPTRGVFTALNNRMITERQSHTATLLPNGKVLLIGGYSTSGSPTPRAELFDPSTGTFNATGSLVTERTGHTSTLLLNGKVLVVGGDNYGYCLSSSELYDPITETFTSTGSMLLGKKYHTATLLPDGRVLIVGGLEFNPNLGGNAPSPITEIYDPSTGVFSRGPVIAPIAGSCTATLLSNGMVLIAGGDRYFNNGYLMNSVLLFNPSTGLLVAGNFMKFERSFHTATLLTNGGVLISGGIDGYLFPDAAATCEIFQ